MSRTASFIIFISIAVAILFVMYGYTGWRLRLGHLPPPWHRWSWCCLVLLMLLVPLGITAENLGRASLWKDILAWSAYLDFGFVSILFMFLIGTDLVRSAGYLGGLALRLAPAVRSAQPVVQPDGESRRAAIMQIINFGLLGATGLLTGYGLFQARKNPGTVWVPIPVKDLPEDLEGFRIVQISDLHVGPTIKRDFIETVVKAVNTLKPDVIALTGDLVDGGVSRLSRDVEPLRRLKSKFGSYFITGNHEYYSGVLDWLEKVRELGFEVLLNNHKLITAGKGRLLMAGVTDYSAGAFIPEHASSPARAMQGAPVHNCSVLLAHQPKSITEAAAAGFDLVLSGHTHGGQYFPFNYLIQLAQPFVRGLHHVGKTRLYVNSGTGYWGPPIRVGAPSEITVIELCRA